LEKNREPKGDPSGTSGIGRGRQATEAIAKKKGGGCTLFKSQSNSWTGEKVPVVFHRVHLS